jgi:hypothetical protein
VRRFLLDKDSYAALPAAVFLRFFGTGVSGSSGYSTHLLFLVSLGFVSLTALVVTATTVGVAAMTAAAMTAAAEVLLLSSGDTSGASA